MFHKVAEKVDQLPGPIKTATDLSIFASVGAILMELIPFGTILLAFAAAALRFWGEVEARRKRKREEVQ